MWRSATLKTCFHGHLTASRLALFPSLGPRALMSANSTQRQAFPASRPASRVAHISSHPAHDAHSSGLAAASSPKITRANPGEQGGLHTETSSTGYARPMNIKNFKKPASDSQPSSSPQMSRAIISGLPSRRSVDGHLQNSNSNHQQFSSRVSINSHGRANGAGVSSPHLPQRSPWAPTGQMSPPALASPRPLHNQSYSPFQSTGLLETSFMPPPNALADGFDTRHEPPVSTQARGEAHMSSPLYDDGDMFHTTGGSGEEGEVIYLDEDHSPDDTHTSTSALGHTSALDHNGNHHRAAADTRPLIPEKRAGAPVSDQSCMYSDGGQRETKRQRSVASARQASFPSSAILSCSREYCRTPRARSRCRKRRNAFQ
jgi:hypothetical protein